MIVTWIDRIFWRRFADEYAVGRDTAASACISGMFHVGLILYVALMGLLAPIARALMIGYNVISNRPYFAVENRNSWYVVIATVAALITIAVIRRRYWRYRLTPEMSRPYLQSFDRNVMVLASTLLLVSAFGVMGLMFLVFWP